jgi:hypothetical protein
MAYEFPSPSSRSSYRDQVAAWARFTAVPFSTLPAARVFPETSGLGLFNSSYILPLQRYTCQNKAAYEEVEPKPDEMILQGIRDVFAGGDFTKLGTALMQGTGLSSLVDLAGGIIGAGLQDISLSDFQFKKTLKRQHTFSFTLLAKNSQDAEMIDSICDGFQKHLYPLLLNSVIGKVKPPPMWKIEIVANGGHSKSKLLGNDIQLCVLDTCSINRLDNNAPVLTTDNYFLGVQMALTFYEIEPAYRSMNLGSMNSLRSRTRASQSVAANLGDAYDIAADAL